MIHIGCCGFRVSRQKYFKEFRLVEVQRTFYQLPGMVTAAKWRESAPTDFEYTLKAWQGITHLSSSPTYHRINQDVLGQHPERYGHFQSTDEVFRAWEDTFQIAQTLATKIIVFQCPPNFKENNQSLSNLANFFHYIRRNGVTLVLELRAEWNPETIKTLCQKFNLIHCVDPFRNECQYGHIRYFRLHGFPPGNKMYRYQYQKEDFQFLDNKISEDLKQKREVYCLFNNFSMWDDARAFRKWMKII
jgi:uncharacterized protein YecE (DUF72 family)